MASGSLTVHDAFVFETFFDDPTWLILEDHVDPETIANRDQFGDFVVSYSDTASHDYYRLVEQSVAVIAAFPAVSGARHEDREMILVWGRDVDRVALRTTLSQWWAQQLDSP